MLKSVILGKSPSEVAEEIISAWENLYPDSCDEELRHTLDYVTPESVHEYGFKGWLAGYVKKLVSGDTDFKWKARFKINRRDGGDDWEVWSEGRNEDFFFEFNVTPDDEIGRILKRELNAMAKST